VQEISNEVKELIRRCTDLKETKEPGHEPTGSLTHGNYLN